MNKFLKKYRMGLMAAFGIFIMISFTVPQLIQMMGRQGAAATVMTIDGSRISFDQTRKASLELDALQRISQGVLPGALGIDARGYQWLYLNQDAKRAGFIGGPTDGATFIPIIARQAVENQLRRQYGQFFNQIMANPQVQTQVREQISKLAEDMATARGPLAARLGMREMQVDQTLAIARGIQREQTTYFSAPRASQQRMIREARSILDQAEANVLFIGVDNKLASDLPEPEAAALQDHFGKYKDVAPGAGEMGFGYQRPMRFKLQWLVLDRAGIAAAVRVDPVEVQKRLLDSTTGDPDPVKRRAVVEAALRKELVDQAMQEATLAVRSEVLKATSRLPDDGTYKILPENWASQRPDFAKIAAAVVARVKDQTGLTIPQPTIIIKDHDFTNREDIAKLEGIGGSYIRRGNNAEMFVDIVPVAKELGAPRSENIQTALQVGVPVAEPTEDKDGSRYFFCLLDARNASAPDSLAEVQAQVVTDVKRAQAYLKLKGDIAAYRVLAAEKSLEDVAATVRTGLGVEPDLRNSVRIGRGSGVSTPDAPFNTKAFIDAVADRMETLDPTIALDKMVPQDLVVGVPIPGKHGIAIARITSFSPVTLEQFRTVANLLDYRLAVEDTSKDDKNPFTVESLTKRLKIESMTKSSAEEAAEKAKSTPPAKPDSAKPPAAK